MVEGWRELGKVEAQSFRFQVQALEGKLAGIC